MNINNAPTKLIAICSAGISNDYHKMFLKSFQKYAGEYNFKLLYFCSFSDLYQGDRHDAGEAKIFDLINFSLVDGLIVLSETIKETKVLDTLIAKAMNADIPIVSVDHPIDGCYNISFNYDAAMKEITKHFIKKHHFTRINFIAGIKDNEFSEHRLQVFRSVMEEHGLEVDERRIGYGGFWSDPTFAVIDDFLASDLPLPEAIICANDSMAIAAHQRLTEAGYRIPEDIALSGFDGIEEAMYHIPSFTTARHDFDSTGRTTFEILTRVFAGEGVKQQHYVNSELILGGSCGCVETSHAAGSMLNRSLYHRIEENNNFIRRQIDLVASMTDNVSYDNIFENSLQHFINIITPKIWICVNNDYVGSVSDLNEHLENSRTSTYSRQMEVLLHKQGYDFVKLPNFNVSEMLPNLIDEFDENNNVMFMPLHVHDKTLGYFAMIYTPEYTNLFEMYSFVTNVAHSLESNRIQIKQQQIIKGLEDKYIHDPMTNLFNRRGFYQHLNPLYEQCIRDKRRIMVISIDLNGLKPINDNYGHAEGDNAITVVAKALISISMKDEICARFGGDEYVVAGVVDDDDSYIEEYTSKFQSYLDYYNQHSNKEYTVSASLGMVVCIPNEEQTLDECIKEADDRMYAIKAKHHLCRSR